MDQNNGGKFGGPMDQNNGGKFGGPNGKFGGPANGKFGGPAANLADFVGVLGFCVLVTYISRIIYNYSPHTFQHDGLCICVSQLLLICL